MKKILVVFTGGTIGSKNENQKIDVNESASYLLIEQYLNSPLAQHVHFDTKQPLNILSENLIPDDWQELIACLQETDFSQYEGIIITHGTDTLPFTSACISYAFRHAPIPIVLTASNFPLEHEQADGLHNFASAVDFILDQKLPGIFVVFGNEFSEPIIYLGTRLMESLPFTDQYTGTYGIPFGKMVNRGFAWHDHPLNPPLTKLRVPKSKLFVPDKLQFSSEILYIKPHPGLLYQWYDFTKHKPKAVLHDLYHSGTASTRVSPHKPYSLREFSQYCKEHHVKLYIAPIKNASGDLYSSSAELIQEGVTPIVNTSVFAAMVKLMLAYGSFDTEDEIAAFLFGKPIYYESH